MIRYPWGKTQDGESHHLAHHCADVGACFLALASVSVVRARLEKSAGRKLGEIDIWRLGAIAFLHDCGKLHPGFQAKGSWPEAVVPRQNWHGHVSEGAAIFDIAGACGGRIAENLHRRHLQTWCSSPDLLTSAFAHHGRPLVRDAFAAGGWEAIPAAGYDPVAASAEIGQVMRDWFAPAFAQGGEPLPASADLQHLFCGLVSLADWLGSARNIFTFVPDLDPVYMTRAQRLARQALGHIGLDAAHWHEAIRGRVAFSAFAPGRSPRPMQELVGEWPLDDPLVILEAETGSGKTEAALWRFARLFEAGLVDSLYFALPTRAAARQIHGRVNEALRRLFGDDTPEAVLAVPGYMQAGMAVGQALPGFEVLWDDDPDEKTRLSRWAAESARRYLAATIAVGTVDQAMLAGLKVKHAHLRGAALSRSFLVIDEIHASDSYMRKIQDHLLKMHLGRGGFAMLMSATLGAEARAAWLGRNRHEKRAPSFADALAAPYPVVWGRATGCRAVGAGSGAGKRVAMELSPDWTAADAAAYATAAAERGAKVLVIRNTVKAAIETFAAIRATGGEGLLWQVAGGPALHHSRFAPEDRNLLDREVESALCKDETRRPRGGLIVVGTQTLEQSLDIDADFLITDLCPVDVLLQRIGRLFRHPLQRPDGYTTPRCLVLSPSGGLDRFVSLGIFDNGLGCFSDGGGIYRNLHACELTRRLVLSHPEWAIPEMNRFLVESALHEERVAELSAEKGPAWKSFEHDYLGKLGAEAQAAKNAHLDMDVSVSQLAPFPDDEIVRTRLGAEGARIAFAGKVIGPFGQEIEGVTLPAHWKGLVATEPVPVVREAGMIRFRVGDRDLVYDREGVKREA